MIVHSDNDKHKIKQTNTDIQEQEVSLFILSNLVSSKTNTLPKVM